jgi:hypothetical protein
VIESVSKLKTEASLLSLRSEYPDVRLPVINGTGGASRYNAAFDCGTLAVLLAACCGLAPQARPSIPDDAFIYLPFVHKLLHGHGWAFNAGRPGWSGQPISSGSYAWPSRVYQQVRSSYSEACKVGSLAVPQRKPAIVATALTVG